MSDSPPLQLARAQILEPAGLDDGDLGRALGSLFDRRLDDADLYFQLRRQESWSLEDGAVNGASRGVRQGVGVRAVSGDKTGFAYSDELHLPALLDASKTARSIARRGDDSGPVAVAGRGENGAALYRPLDPLTTLEAAQKVALLEKIDREARRLDARVTDVTVSLSGQHEAVLIATADGRLSADLRPLVRLNVSVIVEQHGRREQAGSGGGARAGYEFFSDEVALWHAREAVRQALVKLDAVAAPAGAMPVVLGPGWPGVLLHEAVGHGLEGDFNRKGTSTYSGRVGERVASALCTVVDDGTLAERRGSLNVDDEGTPTQRTVLIENGVLKTYLQDRHNARLSGVASTGNGRRQSYSHLTMPRMTNTYMLDGPHHPQDIIASVDNGLYAVNFGGGSVDITSGKFVFSASEAYRIENGRITAPVKGATLVGNGPEVMTRISMVGNDMALDKGVGTCGKNGQSVPVGVGQPTLKVDSLTVGGTA